MVFALLIWFSLFAFTFCFWVFFCVYNWKEEEKRSAMFQRLKGSLWTGKLNYEMPAVVESAKCLKNVTLKTCTPMGCRKFFVWAVLSQFRYEHFKLMVWTADLHYYSWENMTYGGRKIVNAAYVIQWWSDCCIVCRSPIVACFLKIFTVVISGAPRTGHSKPWVELAHTSRSWGWGRVYR